MAPVPLSLGRVRRRMGYPDRERGSNFALEEWSSAPDRGGVDSSRAPESGPGGSLVDPRGGGGTSSPWNDRDAAFGRAMPLFAVLHSSEERPVRAPQHLRRAWSQPPPEASISAHGDADDRPQASFSGGRHDVGGRGQRVSLDSGQPEGPAFPRLSGPERGRLGKRVALLYPSDGSRVPPRISLVCSRWPSAIFARMEWSWWCIATIF